MVRATNLVNALHTKLHAVRAIRSVTGRLAAEKLKSQESFPSDKSGHGKPTYRRTPSHHRKKNRVHSVDTEYETDGESYQKSFYAITISTQCLGAIDNRSTTRDEAFTVLDVQAPELKGNGYTLRLKIDTGASGNTLPMRTLRQMYGDKADTTTY